MVLNHRETALILLLSLCLLSVQSFFRSALQMKPFSIRSPSLKIKLDKNGFSDKENRRNRISKKKLLSPLKFKLSEADQSTRTKYIVDRDLIDDDDENEEDDSDELSENIESGGFLKKFSKGIIPLAAFAGFSATPSSKVAVKLAGAAAGGVAGLIAKSTIIQKMIDDFDSNNSNDGGNGGGSVSTSVLAAVKQLNKGPPVVQLTASEVENIAKKCNVASKDLGTFFTLTFAEAVFEAIQTDTMDLTELSEVLDFAVDMNFTPGEIGDGFALAALKLGESLDMDEQGFYEAEYLENSLFYASKLFFLADKMIGSTEGYYGKQTTTALSFFTTESYKEIITKACKKLFRRCIESVLLKPDEFTSEEVDQLREFLTTTVSVSTLRPANMQNMVMEAIKFTLDRSLRMENKVENFENFRKAQKILGWNERELVSTIETRTLPLFVEFAEDLFNQVMEKPDKAAELSPLLMERVEDLNLDLAKAREVVFNIISKMNGDYMAKIDKVYEASGKNIEQAYKIMIAYAHTHQAFSTLSAQLLRDLKLPLPGLPFAEMVRANMFELQLNKGQTGGLTDEMFDLSPNQRSLVKKHLALPKVTTWINQCINEGNFKEEAKSAYQSLLTQYEIKEDEWQATAIDFYYQELSKIAKSRAIPSNLDMERLKDLKNFLGCSEDMINKANMDLLGDKYVKALSESMTPTGVITEEYLEGLERLRTRLGLSKTDSEKLLGVFTRKRIGPIVTDLVDIWKSDTDENYRREMEKKEKEKGMGPPDKSGDPISSQENIFGYVEMGAHKYGGGPNVFMREVLNLVDFYTENHDNQGVNTSSSNPSITATGIAKNEDLVGMYKHFVITRLSEPDEELRKRYIEVEPLFAKILGIEEESQAKVKEALAYNAYKRLLRSVFRQKTTVEPQDIQQFVLLKESLQLDATRADKIFDEASRAAVIAHASSLLRAGRGEDTISITAEQARVLREQVTSLGLDLRKDTGFSSRLVTYLYALEVQYMVDNELQDELQEIQEIYDIPEEIAAEIVEASCKRFISQLLNLALRGAKKYDEGEVARWMKIIMKYAKFVSGPIDADGKTYKADDKKRLINFYIAELESEMSGPDGEISAEDQEELDQIVNKLKEMINLTKDFVAPVQGIAGLLGETPQLAEAGKKTWSWG